MVIIKFICQFINYVYEIMVYDDNIKKISCDKDEKKIVLTFSFTLTIINYIKLLSLFYLFFQPKEPLKN